MVGEAGTKRVGSTPVVVLGPIEHDMLVQNQSPQMMCIWFTVEEPDETLELPPFQRLIAPAGSEGVFAKAPMARAGQSYLLFYSSLAQPVTQG